MILLNGKKNLASVSATVLLAFMATGCSLMHDDLDPCAVKPETHTSVKLKYDYNTRGEDLFASLVGGVTVYAFDSEGKLVAVEERSNSDHGGALSTPEFQIDFSSDVIVPGNTYRFYAVAHQDPGGYSSVINSPGAAFRRFELSPGTHTVDDFLLTLERDESGFVPHAGRLLDALWTTLRPFELEIPEERIPEEGDPQEPDRYLTATVPLMRVTNHVTISFWQTDFPTAIDPAHYDIEIEAPAGNGRLDMLGNPVADGALHYRPYSVRTDLADTGDGGKAACVTADFGLSRLMLDADLALVVTNRITGHKTRIANLPRYLAKGNEAFAAKNWPEQEYLDREYEYSIGFPFGDPIPKWVMVNVAVLSWSKRIQNVDL